MCYCIDYLHVPTVLWNALTCCKMNIFIEVRFLTTKKDGPTTLESDGPYFEIRAHHKSEGLLEQHGIF